MEFRIFHLQGRVSEGNENVIQIDGPTLLMLSESDLREKPLELDCLGDIKRLASAISKLRAGLTLSEPLVRMVL